MRLVCPNCGTQYEVDDSAVPAAGREVQCGSCASTWFQAPARSNVSASAEKGDLPKWVEDIVEDDAAEEAPELPGEAPNIASEPNEDIVSEPELEGLIDTGDLEAGIDEAEAALDEDDDAAAIAAKTAAKAALAATIASNLTGAPATAEDDPSGQVETVQAQTPTVEEVSETVADAVADTPDEAATAVDADATLDADTQDVSTQLETAIKERTSATKEDFPAIAAAELEASQAAASAEAEAATTAADEAIKAAKRAAAVEVAEKAAISGQEDGSALEAAPQDAAVQADPDAAASDAANSDPGAPETDDIEAQIKGALETLDAGKNLPERPSEERLSDYDFTDGDSDTAAVPDEYAAVLPDEADGPSRGPTETYDPADITVDAPETSPVGVVTGPSPVDPMVEAIERDAAEDQTESLAAKLKARVAEAAKAQESSAVGTAGVVLGASAAGIAASGTRRPTAFPKRETEELTSSLRPKSVEGNTLKPRLRPTATPEPKQSRFGQGFIMALALFAVALLIYLFRDQLATAIPALEPALNSYAGFVDNIRLVFQDTIGRLTGSVAGDASS